MRDRRYIEQLRGDARERAEQSRLERAVELVTKYRDFVPFPNGPDRDLTEKVLQRARAVRSFRYKRNMPLYAGQHHGNR
jgi:hypothetical protein